MPAIRNFLFLCSMLGCIISSNDCVADPLDGILPAPPEVGVVVWKGTALEVHRFTKRLITRTISPKSNGLKIEIKQGSIEPITSTEVVPIIEMHSITIAPTKVVVQHLNGKAVGAKDFPKVFEKPLPILVVQHGDPIDPMYQKIFHPESFVLILPKESSPTTLIPHEEK